MSERRFETARYYGKVEETTSLRRQRPVKVRKDRFRRSLASRVWRGFLAVLLVSVSLWAAWSAVEFGLYNPRFHLAAVDIHGAEFVAPSQLKEKFLADQGKSILRAPLRQRTQEVERIPWVRSATVGRIFPNRLWVEVQERVPVAFVSIPAGMALVDEEGVILDYPQKASFTFPVVQGISGRDSPETRRSRMQLFQAVMEELNNGDPPYSEKISEVDLRDPRDARVVVADSAGAVLLHLGEEDFLARFRVYLGHIQEWKQKFSSIQSIDLRYGGQVVINADPARESARPADFGSSSKASRPNATPSEASL